MMEGMMNIILVLVLLWCVVYQVPSAVFAFSNDPCYASKNIKIEISVQKYPKNKYLSAIDFLSDDVNATYSSSLTDVWEPCSRFGEPLTDYKVKQIGAVLNHLHLLKEEISCEQLNKLYGLKIHNFPFDYYYYNVGQIGRNYPANNQSLCQLDLELLEITESPKSTNTVLRNESFCEFRKLKILSLSSIEFSKIEADAFVCLEQLIKINLKYNNLSSLPESIFSHNLRLQIVGLSGNRFNSMIFSSFKPLTNVLILGLNRNRIETLADVISLKRLKHLYMSRNSLREINENVFSQLEEIEHIDLSRNALEEFHAATFRNNPEVKYLSVRGNALKSIPKIDNLSKLKILDLGENKITSINLSDLLDNHADLTDLYLHNNEIERIIIESSTSSNKSKSISKTPSNVIISLSHNRIQSLRNVSLPDRVSEFNVNDNKITTVCVSSLGFTPDTKVRNVLGLYGNPLQCNCVNRQLKLPNYQALITDFNDLECDLLPTPLKPVETRRVKLDRLEDDDVICRIDFNSSEQCVCYGSDDCYANTPNEHCYAVTNLFKSFIIHLCENLTEIPHRGYYTALHRPSLYHMYFKEIDIEKLIQLQFNDDRISAQCVSFHLEKSNIRVIDSDAFNRVTNLEILSLRDNQIRVLPENLFRNLMKLKELYLSNNRLTTLTHQTIVSLITVIKLELHSNSLTHLPIIFTNTNQLLSNNLTNLSLHDNPWSCECEFMQPFYNYLGNKTYIVQRVNEINCIDKQRNKYNVLQFDLSKCKPFLYLTAITTTTTFAVVIITIAALIFIYRREVRVLIYSRYRLRIFGPEVDDDVSSKQYDAFVAYNSKDEDFLVNHLMPGLEAIPNPYRLCIHERDFPAGAFIQDSIIEAVRLSSRTIVLLSENFVESGWCRMEFMTAHAQMMQDRCPRVLLIVLGEIPRNLDPEMELYLRTNTYLKWGERLFWEKLYYAMPDPKVTAPPTEIMPMYQL